MLKMCQHLQSLIYKLGYNCIPVLTQYSKERSISFGELPVVLLIVPVFALNSKYFIKGLLYVHR